MTIKYDIEVSNEAICSNLKRIINQIYKLLPNREEGIDWETPLTTIMEELAGMDRLLIGQHEFYITLLSKLEGLFTLTGEKDFFSYRRTIFECLNIVNSIMKECQD